MSLLEGTRLQAWVHPAVVGTDEFGAEVLVSPNVTVPARVAVYGSLVRPAAAVDNAEGYDTNQLATLLCRRFPWPARTVVVIDGEEWDVINQPIERGMSLMTQHVAVQLAARGRAPAAAPAGRTIEP